MFDEKGMLTDRARGILFWFTLSMIVVVAIIAVITILRACNRIVSEVEPDLVISPGQASVCTGAQEQFAIEDGTVVTWEVTGGGAIGADDGLFTAGIAPGSYTIVAYEVDGRRTAEATVQVVACAPTPTPSPTVPPPTATPSPGVVGPAAEDAQGDVTTYQGGAPAVAVPAGMDIRAASVGADLQVVIQTGETVPAALAGFAGEGEVMVWIALYDPLPVVPSAGVDWLFTLDLDGNTQTGRAPDSSATGIDAGLGDDAVLAMSSAGGAYSAYWLYWDTAQGQFVTRTDGVRYQIDDSRTLVGLAISSDMLVQVAGVTVLPEGMKGRAGVVWYDQQLVDLYP